jgi:hypothetical protein
MNKLFLFGLLTLLFNSINGEIACKDWGSYFNQSTLDGDTCSMLVPTGTGETHCCYSESSGSTTYGQCLGLTDDQYENIGRLINSLEDIENTEYTIVDGEEVNNWNSESIYSTQNKKAYKFNNQGDLTGNGFKTETKNGISTIVVDDNQFGLWIKFG